MVCCSTRFKETSTKQPQWVASQYQKWRTPSPRGYISTHQGKQSELRLQNGVAFDAGALTTITDTLSSIRGTAPNSIQIRNFITIVSLVSIAILPMFSAFSSKTNTKFHLFAHREFPRRERILQNLRSKFNVDWVVRMITACSILFTWSIICFFG